MRFGIGFGLVSLLVCVAIIMLLESMQATSLHQGAVAHQDAEQISGRGADGMPAMYSYKAESYPPNGNFNGIRITDITAGGPMDTYYGLKVGDVITQIGGNDVTALGGQYDMAKAELDQAYQESRPLTINRGGTQMTLPVGGAKNPLEGLGQ
jgi:C-terminal processing protease CtpA/Prc